MADSNSIERELNRAIRNRDDARARKERAIREYERGPATDRLHREIRDAERDESRYNSDISALQRDFDNAVREEAKAKRGW